MKKLLLVFMLASMFGCRKEKEILTSGPPADYLSAANFDKLQIQVAFAKGMKPSDAALSNIVRFLNERLNKPAGIETLLLELPASGKSTFSFDEIKTFESANRTLFSNGKTLAAYVYFADGEYDKSGQDGKVLGIAYGSSSIAIFEKTILEFSGHILQPSTVNAETVVLEHEFGHLVGLVNNGAAMTVSHQDEPNGKHCNNKSCLMYYATEGSNFIANVLGNNIPPLDENCVNDLKKAGGK
jgi:hypothetical protein